MAEINLRNRYGYDIHLESLTDSKWLLKIDEKANYTRIGGKNLPDNIEYVDPEGGPFLSVGGTAGDRTITKIETLAKDKYNDFILTLEDKKDEEVLH